MSKWDLFAEEHAKEADSLRKKYPWEYHVIFHDDKGTMHERITEHKGDADYRAEVYRRLGLTPVKVEKRKHR